MNSVKRILLKWAISLRKPGVVLYGHNVSEHSGLKLMPSLHLKPAELDQTLTLLKSLEIEFLDMAQLVKISQKRFSHNRPWVHVTFDDGYKDNFDVILPIIQKHKVPITVFVSTNHIVKNERFFTYRIKLAILYTDKSFLHNGIELDLKSEPNERLKFYRHVVDDFKKMSAADALNFMQTIDGLIPSERREALDQQFSCDEVMTMKELKALAASEFVTIGSHNHDHVIMNDNVSSREMVDQMTESKSLIEQNLKTECDLILLPQRPKR